MEMAIKMVDILKLEISAINFLLPKRKKLSVGFNVMNYIDRFQFILR